MNTTQELPKGKIQTVCGPIDPIDLGITLCHEHLYHKSYSKTFAPRKPNPKYEYINRGDVSTDQLWWTSYHPYSHEANLDFSDIPSLITDEMKFFKSNNGNSVVEVTTFGKNLEVLKKTSLESGVNIIAGAGYYVAPAMTSSVLQLTTEQIYDNIIADLLVGVNGVKCGVIGEIASNWPIDPFEKRVLIASAQIQREMNVPVIIHPGRNAEAPFEVMRIFQEAGGIPDKTVMSHLDRTLNDQQMLEFAKIDCFNELDLFGNECSYYEVSDVFDMPNDATRIRQLKLLIDEGYGNKITISHDIHTKHRLMKYGGHGFSHILLNVLPRMEKRGYSQQNINDIIINNPREWLTL